MKLIHIEHHRNTNKPKSIDPDKWCDEGPAWRYPFRWATIDNWYIVYYQRRVNDRPRREVASVLLVFTVVAGAFAAVAAEGYGHEVLAVSVTVDPDGPTTRAGAVDPGLGEFSAAGSTVTTACRRSCPTWRCP